MLIVTGPERGKMWFDHNVEDRGFKPMGIDFVTWYEGWLEESLSDQGLRDRLEKHWAKVIKLDD